MERDWGQQLNCERRNANVVFDIRELLRHLRQGESDRVRFASGESRCQFAADVREPYLFRSLHFLIPCRCDAAS